MNNKPYIVEVTFKHVIKGSDLFCTMTKHLQNIYQFQAKSEGWKFLNKLFYRI